MLLLPLDDLLALTREFVNAAISRSGLKQMADETHRRYLFPAIDRAKRWVYFCTDRN